MALVRSETLLLAEAATAACLTCVPGLLLSAAYASFQLLAFNREGKEPSALAPHCVMHYERQGASKVQHLANQLLTYCRSEIYLHWILTMDFHESWQLKHTMENTCTQAYQIS